MDHREELEQQLWEFVFDLLSPEQARAIQQRITSDPEAARMYAETKLQADILGEAVKLRHPPISLVTPSTDSATAAGESTASIVRSRRFPAQRFGNWFATLAAALLLCYLGYAYYRPASPIRDVAFQSAESTLVAQPVHTTVLGAEQLQPSLANYFTVLTKTATGQPRAAEVNVQFYSPDGEVIDSRRCRTDSNGVGQLETAGFAPSESVRMVVAPVAAVDNLPSASVDFSVRDMELSTHLTSDRSLYRPGESVRFRTVTLSRYDLRTPPPTSINVRVLNSQGAMVQGLEQTVETEFGVGSGTFALPDELPAGGYELVARSPENLFPEIRRTIQVRPYTAPKLKKRLDFALDSFSPGEQVVADLSVERADGRIVRNAPLEIVAELDGTVHWNLSTATDEQGKYQIRFDLPQQMARGEGLLQVTVGDDLREQIVEPIPIHMESTLVEFFPESGELVAEVENRVYFFAHDPQNKPLHIEGRIVDDTGHEVAAIETLHDGRGVFSFTPSSDRTYELRLSNATNLTTDPALPPTSQRQFLTLNTGPGVFDADSPLGFELRSSRDDRLVSVAAVCRGNQVGQVIVPAERFAANEDAPCPVSMKLDENASGVIRLTAYDFGAFPPAPIAERLVYRHPRGRLRFDVSGATSAVEPGSQVDLSLLVRDERETGHSAVLGISVVDEAALSLVRDESASLTTHFWLTGQIDDARGLEDADFYLQDDQLSARSLDLLLGTQGWRRFESFPLDQFAATGTAKSFGESAAQGEDALGVVVNEPTAPHLLADNEPDAIGAVSRELEALYETFQSGLRRVGSVLFCGGLALVISLVLLAVMRRATAPVWIPALGAGALCLVLGGVWMAASIERGNPLAGIQNADLKRSKGLAQVEAKSTAELAAMSSELAEQERLEEDAMPVDEMQDQEPPLVELQVMESETVQEEPSAELAAPLGGSARPTAPAPMDAAPATPAPAAEPATSAEGQVEGSNRDHREMPRVGRGQGVASRARIAAAPVRESADDGTASRGGQAVELRQNRRGTRFGVSPEANDKPRLGDALEAGREVADQRSELDRLQSPSADSQRSAGIGGSVAGEQAETRAKAKKERFAFERSAESFSDRPMSRELAEEQPPTSKLEGTAEPAEELVRAEQRERAVRPDQMGKELADADAVPPADSPQPSDEAMSSESHVALDENKLAFTDPVAGALRRLATSPARKIDKLDAATGDRAPQESSGSAQYKFKPLVRRYADWRLTQSQLDQTETVYWNPLVIADEGVPVPVRFRLSGAETSYRLLINGHGGGRLGSYRKTITTASRDSAKAGVDAGD